MILFIQKQKFQFTKYKMVIESLKIKSKYYYNWDVIVYIYDFDEKLVKITKRESRIDANIYYIGYIFKNDIIKPLYLTVNRLFGHIEKNRWIK